MTYTLYTDLSPAETYQWLVDAAQRDKQVMFHLGYQDSDTTPQLYEIDLKKRTSYRNSFSPTFYGTVQSDEGGSLLEGDFRMSSFTVGLYGVIVLFTAFIAASGLSSGGDFAGTICMAGIFIGFPICLLLFGRYLLGGSEERYIEGFLDETFSEYRE